MNMGLLRSLDKGGGSSRCPHQLLTLPSNEWTGTFENLPDPLDELWSSENRYLTSNVYLLKILSRMQL